MCESDNKIHQCIFKAHLTPSSRLSPCYLRLSLALSVSTHIHTHSLSNHNTKNQLQLLKVVPMQMPPLTIEAMGVFAHVREYVYVHKSSPSDMA